MTKDIINIPIYYNFQFYRLEFDDDVFQRRRYIWPEASLTNFWEKIYRSFFNEKAKEYIRHLSDRTIDFRYWGHKSFGITFLNEDNNQYRNTRLEYKKEDILNNRTTIDDKGRRIYKEHDFKTKVEKLVSLGVNEEWAEDLVRRVNMDEAEILKSLAERGKGKEWGFLKSYFLTDSYVKHRLYNQGIKHSQINHDLITLESLIIETNRKLKKQ